MEAHLLRPVILPLYADWVAGSNSPYHGRSENYINGLLPNDLTDLIDIGDRAWLAGSWVMEACKPSQCQSKLK